MPVVVIGAGQAGLAVGHELGVRGVEYVVLERARTAQAWRDRWDSFTLVTPNWTLDLPGSPYDGEEPEGHVPRNEIIEYLETYGADWSVPVCEGVDVEALTVDDHGRLRLATSDGVLTADSVVVCTGAFQRLHRSDHWRFSPGLTVLAPHDYRNPDSLPPGSVLVVGSGETGIQIAEELRLAGREIYLSCGRTPWYPRRLDGIDTVTWLYRVGFYEQRLADISSEIRLRANPQYTGADGGRDLHYRILQDLGIHLTGRLTAVDGHHAQFADDLAASVAFGDARWADVRGLLTERLPALGYDVPDMPIPAPFEPGPTIRELDLTAFGGVVLAAGFRPNYRWISLPIFDDLGYPITTDGRVDTVPGLYFCGVHFMRTRRSGLLHGVGPDAILVAESIANRH